MGRAEPPRQTISSGSVLMLRRLIYRIYEARLESEVRRGAIPHHVGVLPDGNRRFARTTGLASIGAGHRDGADNIERLIDWCDELGIPVITVWALSTDNLNRPAEELEAIFKIVETRVEALADRQQGAAISRRIRSVGRRDMLPASTVESIQRVEQMTAGNDEGDLIIAIGYGGRDEIVDAVRRMIGDHAGRGETLADLAQILNAEEIGSYLYAPDIPDPDLVIRTSGELRLSGFMLWQSAFSEYYFCEAYWPAFRRIDFLRAIRSYGQRQRRRGR
ncbi:MAG: polyprenyl diphosphate synthase [Chloroflexi bacterium]|nr:polyprenyl diphosphate synthase [Chloroflexota bacterium]MDE2863318.1 polyprenyl diphosphate synthase [Chloroflexota bacterium]